MNKEEELEALKEYVKYAFERRIISPRENETFYTFLFGSYCLLDGKNRQGNN